MSDVRKVCLGILSGVATVSLASALVAADAPANAAEATVHAWTSPAGETTFALSLRAADLPQAEASPRDVVLLVDTSASQAGEHRTQALAVVDELVRALPAGSRVCLYAVDVKQKQLSSGFVAADSAEMKDALGELARRFPAGATDLGGALSTALDAVEEGSSAAVVYLGDGMSMADLVQTPALKTLLENYTARRIPVHSYALGPRTDPQLLGILALQT
ncbi:MAG: VWA domain-containing protein, partial [Planctomycetes bacterium]|nr:VWA domain-containing protein [Planctomycetota bacterium]